MKLISISSLLLIVAMFLRCVTSHVSGPDGDGNGSETIARGIIVDSTGAPIAGIPIQLLPVSYNPVFGETLSVQWHTLTDTVGKYSFNGIGAGTYNVEAGSSSAGMKALVKGIKLTGDNNVVAIDTARLQKTGTVIVNLMEMSPRVGDYIYIPGTNVFTIITDADSIAGNAILRDIPAESFTDLNIVEATDSQKNNLLTDPMVIHPGDTIVFAYVTWKYTEKLYLNTTASGAGISENVYGFPVLIRLTESIFDFTQVNNRGEDIRFTKSDGTPLAYEIERWDSIEKRAEIWVKVDTVKGNNDLQFFVMYWGNSDIEDESDDGAVFDTSRGFQGVWHLNEDGNTTAMDATSNRYDGTPYNMTSESSVPGMIGRAQDFDGKSSRVNMLNTSNGKLDFPENGTYSMSLWAYADTIDNSWHGIAGKGHRQYYLQYKCFSGDTSSWEFVQYQDKAGWEYSEYFPQSTDNSKQWVYLTGVRDGNKQYLYVNGELVMDTTLLNPDTCRRVTGGDFTIGCHLQVDSLPEGKDFNFFDGKVDEVRVMSTIPNADWVRLCYMNQKADDKLVVFK